MTAVSHSQSFAGLEPWNKGEDTVYALNRGDLTKERDRLEYNHKNIFLPLCGGLCPQEVLTHLTNQQTPRVAEIATGTGIWLRDMAKLLPPSAELRGIDMDTTKFPPPSALPPNISLLQHNALKSFPDGMHGSFDMVHIRLIGSGMRKEDWKTVASNAFTLLRPGGYIHWEEAGETSWKCVPPSCAFDEWSRIRLLWSLKVGRNPFMPAQLPLVLRDAGFTDIDEKVWNTFGIEGMMRESMRKIATEIIRPVMLSILEAGGVDTLQSSQDIDRLESEMERDIQDGALIGVSLAWFWGRHP
ncbi:hypothetical protein CORC01_08492 [Colletotrichum orchidophilum]|uniref:Methyltransferase domain-containing protein n=1 Tax=Colletotrichum orchidophilum TaxID=1209926 RepID=A0A1G4B4E7_9PEZI|nr:uncharacterized protein CORC01_08492 [Colletotrichum orchidophilum]OHE96274.1 hypothetical protein CORC01_08492 [Colletotrichum orchidophilum]